MSQSFTSQAIERSIKATVAGESRRVSFPLNVRVPAIPESLDFSVVDTDKGPALVDPVTAAVWSGFIDSYFNGIRLNVTGLDKDTDYPSAEAVREAVQVAVANGYDWADWDAYLAAMAETQGRITPAQRAAALRLWIEVESEQLAEQASKGVAVSQVYAAVLGALALALKGNGPQSVSAWFSWLSAPVGLRADGSLKSTKQVENLSIAILAPESKVIPSLCRAWQDTDPALLGRFASDLSEAFAQHQAPDSEDESDF